MKEKESKHAENTRKEPTGDLSRRQFFKDCGLVFLATASYSVLSIFEQRPVRTGKTEVAQDYDCFEYCMSDCTGCTAGCTGDVIVPCYDCTSDYIGGIPEPGPPECVMYFSECQTDCQYNCTYSM